MGLQVDPASMQKRTGKSLWVGLNNEVVNVETYALQHYEMTGYVGYVIPEEVYCKRLIISLIVSMPRPAF